SAVAAQVDNQVLSVLKLVRKFVNLLFRHVEHRHLPDKNVVTHFNVTLTEQSIFSLLFKDDIVDIRIAILDRHVLHALALLHFRQYFKLLLLSVWFDDCHSDCAPRLKVVIKIIENPEISTRLSDAINCIYMIP